MAMTGSGSASDPWVPTTWDDFVKIFTSDNGLYNRKNYISIPEGTVWDMNELYPKGLEQITTYDADRGYFIYGNNVIIKNLYSRGNYAFNWRIGTYASTNRAFQMYDVHFENLHLDGGFFTISWTGTYDSSDTVYFYGCTFSGISNSYDAKSPGIFVSSNTSGRKSYFTFDVSPYTNHGCGFNMEGINTALFYVADNRNDSTFFNVNYAHIIYNGQYLHERGGTYSYDGDIYFLGCYIEGSCMLGSSYGHIKGNTSIFDVKTSYANPAISADALMIINTDKYTGTSSGWKKVTTTQLQDAAYLRSLGFPIAVNGS